MKITILSLVALFIASAASLHAAGNTDFKCTVTGTVQTQLLLSPTSGRIHTGQLNGRRILQEFGVSSTDYELVLSLGSNPIGLYLIPKHSGAGLTNIPVVQFGDHSQIVTDTRTRVIKISSDVKASTAENIFKDSAGEIGGTVHYTGPFDLAVYKSAVLSMTGRGTDPVGNGSALLKFKITTKGNFTQVP